MRGLSHDCDSVVWARTARAFYPCNVTSQHWSTVVNNAGRQSHESMSAETVQSLTKVIPGNGTDYDQDPNGSPMGNSLKTQAGDPSSHSGPPAWGKGLAYV